MMRGVSRRLRGRLEAVGVGRLGGIIWGRKLLW
jgi:hypothetical protein